ESVEVKSIRFARPSFLVARFAGEEDDHCVNGEVTRVLYLSTLQRA
ncbi:unnamed protein product, partial [Amoebophrya sp. A25]